MMPQALMSLLVVFLVLVYQVQLYSSFRVINKRYGVIPIKSRLCMKHDIKSTSKRFGSILTAGLVAWSSAGFNAASAKPEGVNRPELLPQPFTTVIDVANYLTKGQEKKISNKIADLEKNKGFKLRVLLQKYPETPGLAIKDYWNVDANTVVMVIDEGQGFNSKGIPRNIINLNIGKNAEDQLPNIFWSRLVNKLGNSYYVKDNGVDVATINAVEAITLCLQEQDGCKELPFEQ